MRVATSVQEVVWGKIESADDSSPPTHNVSRQPVEALNIPKNWLRCGPENRNERVNVLR